jgi:hypothetical protein
MKTVSPIIVQLIGDQKFRLYEDLKYEDSKLSIVVLKGFEFDGLSKPSAIWSIMGSPFGGLDTIPGAFHDAFYATGLFSRRESDYFFYGLLIVYGVDKPKARAMYYAVRAGGESHYGKMSDMVEWREYVKIELKG